MLFRSAYLDWRDDLTEDPDLEPISQYLSWTYDAAADQVTFIGAACEAISRGQATPVLVWCPDVGG